MLPRSAAASMTSHHSAGVALAWGGLQESGGQSDSVEAVFSHQETVKPRPVHPDSKVLFAKCDGRMGILRDIPLFGPAVEAFGYKFIISLDLSEFLSKGVANYTLQNSFFPMFTNRFGAGAMAYQRYQNVALMGWSIKPLTALISDSLALFGYSKRWYMVISAVGGAVCCFAYAVLPAKTSSGPIAAAFMFLAGFCQGNLDILSEGFYSRLMRQNPRAGPALVSTVWWMLSLGNIAAAFIEGPLSDAGKEAVGAHIAGACMVATIPLFAWNMFGERRNRLERAADALALHLEREHQQQLDALAAARQRGSGTDRDEGGCEPTEIALEMRAAGKNAALMASAEAVMTPATTATAATPGAASREGEGSLVGIGDDAPDMVGFSMELAGPLVGGAAAAEGHGGGGGHSKPVGGIGGLHDDLVASMEVDSEEPDELAGGPRDPTIRRFCGGAVEFNEEVLTRNWRIVVYAAVMTVGVIALAVVTILPGMYPLLVTSVSVSVVLSFLSFWALPGVVAKASLFAFLSKALYVQITGPLNSFYLATPECLPGGPHFSYFFFNTISSVVGSVANMGGVMLFTYIFFKRSYRLTFIVTTLFEVFGSIFDLILVKRWNIAAHIPDHVMYICGDAVVYQVAYMLNWMPMVVLLSQLCPRGSESIVYALLAGFSNVGATMATEAGTLIMDFVWPITTTPPEACNFDHLPILIVVSHLCVPLLQIPLVFFLIPSARVCDELDSEGRVIEKDDVNIGEVSGGGTRETPAISAETCTQDGPLPGRLSDSIRSRAGREAGVGGGEGGLRHRAGLATAAGVSLASAHRSQAAFAASMSTSVRVGGGGGGGGGSLSAVTGANASVRSADLSRSNPVHHHRYQPIPLVGEVDVGAGPRVPPPAAATEPDEPAAGE